MPKTRIVSPKAELLKVMKRVCIPGGLPDDLMQEWTHRFPGIAETMLRRHPDDVLKVLNGLPFYTPPADLASVVAADYPKLLTLVEDDIKIEGSDKGLGVRDVFNSQNSALRILSVSKQFEELTHKIVVRWQPERRLASFSLNRAATDTEIQRELGDGYEVDFIALRDLLVPFKSVCLSRFPYSNVFYANGLVVSCLHTSEVKIKKGWSMFANNAVNNDCKWSAGTRIFTVKK